MLLERFSQLIDESGIGAAVEARRKILNETDPDYILVERVRHFFGVSTKMAKALCELAVREGLFLRGEAVLCPIDEQIITDTLREKLPEKVHCQVCEGFGREADYPLSKCKQMTFYRINPDRR